MIHNKKGFTLIELITTITIIIIIIVIAIPTSLTIVEKGKQKEYELIRDKILVASEKYFYDNENDMITSININNIMDYIDIDEKYILNNKIMDPRSDSKNQKCLNGTVNISYNTLSYDKATFTYVENESISCN